MINFEDQINQFISEYNVNSHEQAKSTVLDFIKKDPNNIKLLQKVGLLFVQNKQLKDAIFIFKKILEKDFNSTDTLINLALVYYELNKFDEALKYLMKAERLGMQQSEVSFNLGLVYEKKHNKTVAFKYYKKALEKDSSNVYALLNIANIHLQNKDFENAIKNYENAIRLNPSDSNIYHNLAVVLAQLDKIDHAIHNYLKAIKLDSKNSLTYYNLGFLYSQYFDSDLSQLKKAELNFKKAIDINSTIPKFFYNLAWVQARLEKYDSAILNYKKSINIDPNYTNAIYNLSRLYLATENFEEGWPIYDKIRINKFKKDSEYTRKLKNILNLKKWNGQKFDGRLFVYGEQGIGDQILYSSMLLDLSKVHFDINLSVDSRIVDLFKRSFKNINVSSYDTIVKTNINDCHIPLFSLGSYFRNSMKDFKPSPYLIPDVNKVKYYKKILSNNNKFKIGLSWKTKSDSAEKKNLSLNKLSKLLLLDNCEFVNIQYGDTSEERENFKSEFGKELINIENLDLMNDFEGLAALIASCDLVITITNATAQLAGSIGAPTWVMLHSYPHWEWFVNRSDSLWYPNIKLFRQIGYNTWENVITNLHRELLKKTLTIMDRGSIDEQ